MPDVALSILLCTVAFIWLAWLLRRDRVSLGIPIAYMATLLMIHLPGAFTRIVTNQFDFDADIIEIGIRFTAIGCLCFVVGVHAARLFNGKSRPICIYVERREFWYFCLIGGLVVQFGLRFLQDLPSAASVIDRGSLLWTLGAVLGLRFALSQRNLKEVLMWATAAMIYPVLILLMSGFLSYGSAAVIIVASALVVSVRSRIKLIVAGSLAVYLGLSLFVNYFAHREEFREIAWSGASTSERFSGAVGMFSDFQWFNPTNVTQLNSLNVRLNQNYFEGVAATRIEREQVSYLYGRSIWEGVLALVPRFVWPEKPVFGGSGTIVAEMTGLKLDLSTSWGVGNVMEFQVNFGTPGVVIGFLILGFLIGWLDYRAAAADARGDIGRLILFFLIGLALTQPGGSIVEIAGGAAAAAIAAYGWKWLWQLWLWWSGNRAPSREFAASR
jgi:hypothetical protein